MVTKIINPNYKKAQDTAYRLVKSCSLLKGSTFPIDPTILINNKNNIALNTYSRLATCTGCSIEDVERTTGSNDGTTFFDPRSEKYVVAYNDMVVSASRKRFTIAHELGHICLGHLIDKDTPNNVYKVQEKEANYFAKRFLVPLPFFTRLLQKTTLEYLSTSDISFIFNVSLDVAKYSIQNYKGLSFPPTDEKFCDAYDFGLSRMLSIVQMAHRMATIA